MMFFLKLRGFFSKMADITKNLGLKFSWAYVDYNPRVTTSS